MSTPTQEPQEPQDPNEVPEPYRGPNPSEPVQTDPNGDGKKKRGGKGKDDDVQPA